MDADAQPSRRPPKSLLRLLNGLVARHHRGRSLLLAEGQVTRLAYRALSSLFGHPSLSFLGKKRKLNASIHG
jgi:hypothetical protein